MKVSKKTVEILKNFSTINTNLVINPGKSVSTVSVQKDIMAEASVDEDFDKQLSIFNLNEFLGVLSSFNDPEIELEDKWCLIKEGSQVVKYVYAEAGLLTTPTKSITMPKAEVSFDMASDVVTKVQKMAGVLTVGDLAFIGDGKKIVVRVFDAENPTGNQFDVDMGIKTKETFDIRLKIEKLKLLPGEHKVEISSKKISKFTNTDFGTETYISVEASSKFN